jgi:hypothetical protein
MPTLPRPAELAVPGLCLIEDTVEPLPDTGADAADVSPPPADPAADLDALVQRDPAQAEKLRELLRRSLIAPSKLNDTATPPAVER